MQYWGITLKTTTITWNLRACRVFYLHLMKWMLTQEMNGWQVQRSGAHTALCTLKYLRTSKGEKWVTCVTIAYKKGLSEETTWRREKEMKRPRSNKQTNKYRQMGEKKRQTNGQTKGQRGRQTDRQRLVRVQLTDRQTYRPTVSHSRLSFWHYINIVELFFQYKPKHEMWIRTSVDHC